MSNNNKGATYYQRRIMGICVRCGTKPSAPNRAHCENCTEEMRKHSKRRTQKGKEQLNQCQECELWTNHCTYFTNPTPEAEKFLKEHGCKSGFIKGGE